MKRSKKVARLRFWLFVFRLSSFLVSIVPLGVFFLNNFDRYVKEVRDVWKLSAGAVVIVVIMLFKVLGKLKVPGRVVGSALFMFMCWLFSSLLADLLVISTIWCMSEVADYMIFSPMAGAIKRRLALQETAEATALAQRALGG